MKRGQRMLDIVVVNYNSTDYLLNCLKSIYDSMNGNPINVLIQDNGSEDDVDRVLQVFPQVRLAKSSNNMGFAKAINKGLDQCESPYIAIINPDTMVLDDCFHEVLEYMEKNPGVGIVGPKVLDVGGTVQGSARAFPTPLTAFFGRNTILTKLFPNNSITRRNVLTKRCANGKPIEVDWVSGACMVLRREAIDDVGLMDPRFFLYWEDADWCRRMWAKGWKVVYYPQPSLIHYVGGSSSKTPIRSLVEFHKNCYKFFNKYNRPYLRFINPFVAGTLASRLVLSILIHKTGPQLKKLMSRKSGKELQIIQGEKNEDAPIFCPSTGAYAPMGRRPEH
jgi:GT2 family glycosyltransferase